MIIGVDFDNTIVGYDTVFHAEALRQGLIPRETPVSKKAVCDYLRACDREIDWTRLQGRVYGACMAEAPAFPGVIEFFKRCRRAGIAAFIISHKTRTPYEGERYDLHEAASDWLTSKGFFDPDTGLGKDKVFWELTKEEKIARIKSAGCTHFIDDLPDILSHRSFPAGVERILFDPNSAWPDQTGFIRIAEWTALPGRFLGQHS